MAAYALRALAAASLKSQCWQGHVLSESCRGESFLVFSSFWGFSGNIWDFLAYNDTIPVFAFVFTWCSPCASLSWHGRLLRRTSAILDQGLTLREDDLIFTNDTCHNPVSKGSCMEVLVFGTSACLFSEGGKGHRLAHTTSPSPASEGPRGL